MANQEAGRLSIDVGQTRITFLNAAANFAEPFYHFAFNVPENKLLDAHRWLSQRTALIPIPQNLRDSNYPDDVVHYRHWNAHSLFFFDPAGNVVEFIARHDLDNAAQGRFSSDDILYASEIAFVVDDVAVMQSALAKTTGFLQYKGASDAFAAIGDENGLILLMKRGRMISFDAPEKKTVAIYPTKVACKGKQRVEYQSSEYPYELTVDQ